MPFRALIIAALVLAGITAQAGQSLFLANPSPVSNGVKVLVFNMASNLFTPATTKIFKYTNGILASSDDVFQQLSSNRIAFLSDMPAFSTQRWDLQVAAPGFGSVYGHVGIVTNTGSITNWKKYDITNGYAGFSVIDPASTASTNRYPLAGIIAPNGTQTMTNSLLFQTYGGPGDYISIATTNCATNILQRFIDAGPLRVEIETVMQHWRQAYPTTFSNGVTYPAGPSFLTNTIRLDANRRRVRWQDKHDVSLRVALDISSAAGQFNQLRMRPSDAMNRFSVRLWSPLYTNGYPEDLLWRTDCVWPVTTNTTISPYYSLVASNGLTDIFFQLMYGGRHTGGVGSYDIGDWLLFADTNAAAATPIFGMIQGDMSDERASYPQGWSPYNSATNFAGANGRFGFLLGMEHRAPDQGNLVDTNHVKNWAIFVGTNGMLNWATNEFFWEMTQEYADETGFSSQDVVRWNLDTSLLAAKQFGYVLMEEGVITNVNRAIELGNTTLSNELYTLNTTERDVLPAWGPSVGGSAINTYIDSIIATSSNLLWSLMNGDGAAPGFANTLQGSEAMSDAIVDIDQALWKTNSHAKAETLKFFFMFWPQVLFDRGYFGIDAVSDESNRQLHLGSESMPSQISGARDMMSVFFNPEYTNGLNSLLTVSNNMAGEIGLYYPAGISRSSPHYSSTRLARWYDMMALQQRGIDFTAIAEHTNSLKRFMEWYLTWLSPIDPRFQMLQSRLVPIRDSDWENPDVFGDLASLWRTNDVALQGRLVGAWRRGGGQYNSFFLNSALAAIPGATSNAPAITSGNFLGTHSHYRSANDTTNETALWLINGSRMTDHAVSATGDAGELTFYALGNLQGGQYGRNSGANSQLAVWTANTTAREELVPTWNGTNSASEQTGEWNGNTNRNYVQFRHSWWADAEITNGYASPTNAGWTRSVKVFQADPEWPVIQVIDLFTGTTAISNRVLVRKLTGTGDVVIAGNTFSPKQTSAALSETPAMTNTFSIPTGGVFRIQTTGQVFTAHSARGTDLDWWLWQPTNSEVTAGTHRQGVHDELAKWALGGTAYLLQHEFRVRSSNGFHSLFIPRNKGWSAPTLTTNGDGSTIFIALTNSGWYRLSNNVAEFSRTTTNIAAQVFSGTAQFIGTNGIGISGGPAEVSINRGANTNFTISLSGAAGTRTITNASLPYPLVIAASGRNVTRHASR